MFEGFVLKSAMDLRKGQYATCRLRRQVQLSKQQHPVDSIVNGFKGRHISNGSSLAMPSLHMTI